MPFTGIDQLLRNMKAFDAVRPAVKKITQEEEVNINIIKKIESSEMNKRTLGSFKKAMENLTFFKDIAFIHMGKVSNPDILVIMADFFLKLAEASWCIVSGIYGQKIIVIFRNVGFRRDAGKMAQKLFGDLGSAGGHKGAARAEFHISEIEQAFHDPVGYGQFILGRIKGKWRKK